MVATGKTFTLSIWRIALYLETGKSTFKMVMTPAAPRIPTTMTFKNIKNTGKTLLQNLHRSFLNFSIHWHITLYEDGGSALRGVSGNFPGKAFSSIVVSTFLRRYWLVVCSELTLSTEEEQSYQNASNILESLLKVIRLLCQ